MLSCFVQYQSRLSVSLSEACLVSPQLLPCSITIFYYLASVKHWGLSPISTDIITEVWGKARKTPVGLGWNMAMHKWHMKCAAAAEQRRMGVAFATLSTYTACKLAASICVCVCVSSAFATERAAAMQWLCSKSSWCIGSSYLKVCLCWSLSLCLQHGDHR